MYSLPSSPVLNSDCCLPLLFSTKPRKQWSSHERSIAYFPVSLTVLTLVPELLFKDQKNLQELTMTVLQPTVPTRTFMYFGHNQVIFQSTLASWASFSHSDGFLCIYIVTATVKSYSKFIEINLQQFHPLWKDFCSGPVWKKKWQF